MQFGRKQSVTEQLVLLYAYFYQQCEEKQSLGVGSIPLFIAERFSFKRSLGENKHTPKHASSYEEHKQIIAKLNTSPSFSEPCLN